MLDSIILYPVPSPCCWVGIANVDDLLHEIAREVAYGAFVRSCTQLSLGTRSCLFGDASVINLSQLWGLLASKHADQLYSIRLLLYKIVFIPGYKVRNQALSKTTQV